MSSPIIAPPLAGTVVGSANDSFVIAQWQDSGGPAGPPRYIAPLHLHHHDDEAWYVLEGNLCVQRGEEVVEAQSGSAVFVQRGIPHTYWNPGPGRLRYLLIMTGNTYALIQAMHGLKERTPEAMRGLFAKYDSELLG